MRKQEIFPDMIIRATISLAAQCGLESVSTRKVAEKAGISEGSIFNYFRSKTALLVRCLYYIDNEIDQALRSVPFQNTTVEDMVQGLWYAYFRYLSEHGDCAKYYRQFRHSHYYSQEVMGGQTDSFAFFSQFLKKNISIIDINHQAFWVFMIETTLEFAIRVADGEFPNEPEQVGQLYNLLMHGVVGSLNPDVTLQPFSSST